MAKYGRAGFLGDRKVTVKKTATSTEVGPEPTNDAEFSISKQRPYTATVTVEGTCDILFHRYSVEDVQGKEDAAKGSDVKKTDNVEAYVYRDEEGNLCIPGEYLRGSIVNASKYKSDPRSPRKSLMDMAKAGIVCLTRLASLGVKKWDYVDARRVGLNRAAVTRRRPAVAAGWKATFDVTVLLPQYISPALLNELIQDAGKLVGFADHRPSYGRFQVVNFAVREA